MNCQRKASIGLSTYKRISWEFQQGKFNLHQRVYNCIYNFHCRRCMQMRKLVCCFFKTRQLYLLSLRTQVDL